MTTRPGIGVHQGTAMTIGAVLGTGVLTLPALAAQLAGPASLVAWLALILLSIPLAATFAGLGARFPDGGGVATYAREAFGDRTATVVGWWFYFFVPIGGPASAGFAGAYVADFVGGGRTTQFVTASAIMAAVVGMNWFGIRISGRVQLVIAGTLGLMLALATVVSLPHARLANLTPFAPHGWLAVGSAAAMLVWAFAGWEAVASLTGEYADPAREIPRVTAWALAVISVLYLGVAFAVVSVLGATASAAPVSDLLALGFGPGARPLTTMVAVLLSVGAMNAYIASVARLGAALGRDGALPVWFASTDGGEPRRSLAVIGLLTAACVGTIWSVGASLEVGVLFVTGAFSLVYVVATAAAVVLLPRGSAVWWGAGLSCAGTLALAGFSGVHLIPAAVVAGLALLYSASRRSRAT